MLALSCHSFVLRASSDNRLCWWQLLCRKQQFLWVFFNASKYENESLVQDAMRLPPLKLQSKEVCRVQNKDKGHKTKKTKANQKPFEASCNHLGLTELEREGERIPWARVDDHRSRARVLQSSGNGGCWGDGCRGDLYHEATRGRTAVHSHTTRRLSLPAIGRQAKKYVLIQSIS